MTRYGGVVLIGLLFASASCAGILGLRRSQRRPFEHQAHVQKGIHCLKCHSGVATAGEEGPPHFPSTAQCVECHKTPHDARDCDQCHGRPHAREAVAEARENLRFEHRTHTPRVHGDCVRCHIDAGAGAEVLRPSMASCMSCHPHDEQVTKNDCAACHIDIRREGVMPSDHLVHEGDFLKTHGVRAAGARETCASCHAESFCTGCHGVTSPVTPERAAFDDPLRIGVHRAGFVARHANEARADPGLCTTCHAPERCTRCHEEKGLTATSAGAHSPHPSGWLGVPGSRNDHGRAAWRDPALCASCHGGAGEALCIGCHRVGGVGGNPHPPGWSSTKRPRVDVPCRLCHGGGP